MLLRWTKNLLVLFICFSAFTACKKNYSTDPNPTPVYMPSVIITSDNHIVYSLDLLTGKKIWEYTISASSIGNNASIIASPLLYNEMLYICVRDTIFKLDSRTGQLKKKITISPYQYFNVNATPIADGKLVYLSTTNDTLYAIDTGSGAIQWKFGMGAPLDGNTFSLMLSSPTIRNGNVYVASYNGGLYSLNKSTGLVNWQVTGKGAFTSSPAVNDSFVYIGSTDNNLYCFKTSDGSMKWSYATQGAINSSPTVSKGICIVGSDDFTVHCVDTATGKKRWTIRTAARIVSSPFTYGQTVYISSYDNSTYGINVLNGAVKWKASTNGIVSSSPLGYGPNIYIGSYDKYFYALDTATGTMNWKQNINGIIECSPVVDDLSGTSYNSGISGYTN